MEYTSLEALKAFGGGFDDSEDAKLFAMIQSASVIIKNYTGRTFKVESETDQVFSRVPGVASRFNGKTLYFFEELAEEASAITDSPTVSYLPENGPPYYAMVLTDGAWAYPTVTVTGYWGHSKDPSPAIEMACLRLSKWLYDMGEGGGSAAIFTPEGRVLLPQGLPQDVITILKPYKKVVVA
jgi:hypothetical protein